MSRLSWLKKFLARKTTQRTVGRECGRAVAGMLRHQAEDGPALMVRAGILCKAGRFEDALRCVEPSPPRPTGSGSSLWASSCGRKATRGLHRRPSRRRNGPIPTTWRPHLAGGYTFFDAHRWKEERFSYQRDLAREPAQDFGKAVGPLLRMEADRQAASDPSSWPEAAISVLEEFSASPTSSPHADRCVRPAPGSSARPYCAGQTPGTIASTPIEAPSNRLASRSPWPQQASIDRFPLSRRALSRPDPLQPVEAVRYKL